MLKQRRRKGEKNERMCLGCRNLRDKKNLLRVASLRDGRVIIDEAQKLGGRGAYICPYADCLIASVKKRGWTHGLKRPIDPETMSELLSQLKRHTLWMSGDLSRLW